jgi:hypothetical protein
MGWSVPCIADSHQTGYGLEVRFKVLTSDTFWDMVLCILVGIYLHLGESAAYRSCISGRTFTLKLGVEVTSALLVSFYTTTLHNNAEDANVFPVPCLQHPTLN